MPALDLTYLSSSLVREVARFGGDVSALVHPAVATALAARFRPMSFRRVAAAERAAARRRRIVLCEGDDPRVQAAAARLRARQASPSRSCSGASGSEPVTIRGFGRIAQFLRERRPDRIRDGVHALDIAAVPVNFGAALVALGEADGAVAGAVCPTARHDPRGALGHRHRAGRAIS